MASTITPSLHGYQAFHGFLAIFSLASLQWLYSTGKPAMASSFGKPIMAFFPIQACHGFQPTMAFLELAYMHKT